MSYAKKITVPKWISPLDENRQFDTEDEAREHSKSIGLRRAIKAVVLSSGKSKSDAGAERSARDRQTTVDILIAKGVLSFNGIKPVQELLAELHQQEQADELERVSSEDNDNDDDQQEEYQEQEDEQEQEQFENTPDSDPDLETDTDPIDNHE